MSDGQLHIRDLSVSYPRATSPTLDGITLERIEPGRMTVFAGPNGAGKSTLLKAIAGTVRYSGVIRLGDTDLANLPPREKSGLIGFMPQSGSARARLTVLEAVLAATDITSGLRASRQSMDAACDALERLGILHLAQTPLASLSGGQRQLAVLAQSLARRPPVLLLDEPTSALDLRHQFEVMAVLQSLADEGTTIILVLHDLTLAARWAGHFVFLADGRIAAAGAAAETLTPALLHTVYGIRAEVATRPDGAMTIHVLAPG
ncbi:ABC transporter ATP-binding protein [uncultured Martelella sp.]|uniref:ABC transporter ATP-binding protein n=1 Tax=uncultured Martelella sp. TaxID=392331 RepID=UPI0029C85D52|nr:ABC transporter ATP-binding protein [uncultured Martelella sp.]